MIDAGFSAAVLEFTGGDWVPHRLEPIHTPGGEQRLVLKATRPMKTWDGTVQLTSFGVVLLPAEVTAAALEKELEQFRHNVRCMETAPSPGECVLVAGREATIVAVKRDRRVVQVEDGSEWIPWSELRYP